MVKSVVAVFLIGIGISYADIKWLGLTQGFKKARQEEKLIMIYIYSSKCYYCKKMEATTFKDPQIQEIVNKNFVAVKVRKCDDEGQFIRKEYGYLGTPTFHFLTPDGKKIKSIFGAWNKKEFLKILKYFYEKHYLSKSMTQYFMDENKGGIKE
jgi:thioredoxin-related protein